MKYIKPILGATLGFLFLISCIWGYPAAWFIHGTLGDVSTPGFQYLINSAIFIILIPLVTFLLGYYKNMGMGVFGKYSVLFLSVLLVTLLFEYFGHFGDYSYMPSFELLVFDGIFGQFLRNASTIIALILFVKSISLLPINKWKNLIVICIGIILYTTLEIIYHIGFSPLLMTMYIVMAFGISTLTGFLVVKENALVTPAIFYGLVGLCGLPCYFALNSATPQTTMILNIVLYFIIAVCIFADLIYEMVKGNKKELIEKVNSTVNS